MFFPFPPSLEEWIFVQTYILLTYPEYILTCHSPKCSFTMYSYHELSRPSLFIVSHGIINDQDSEKISLYFLFYKLSPMLECSIFKTNIWLIDRIFLFVCVFFLVLSPWMLKAVLLQNQSNFLIWLASSVTCYNYYQDFFFFSPSSLFVCLNCSIFPTIPFLYTAFVNCSEYLHFRLIKLKYASSNSSINWQEHICVKGLRRQMLVLRFAYEIQMGKEQDSKRTASLNFRAFHISLKLLCSAHQRQ